MARGATTKYPAIVASLREQIVGGTLAVGARLPSENALAEQHGVHRFTARRALEELTHDGLVERVRGSGTFVISPGPARPPLAATDCAGLFVRATGHLFGDQARYLAGELQRRGLFTLLLDLSETRTGAPGAEQAWCEPVRRALETDLAAIIVDAHFLRYVTGAAPELRERPNILSFGLPNASLKEVGLTHAHSVYSDCFLGGRLATAHLIERGHRRLVLCSYGYPPRRPGEAPRLTREVHQRQFRAGCWAAMRDAGLDPHSLRLVTTGGGADVAAEVDQLLRAPDAPTAVLAMGDWRARFFYDAARRLGLEIGRDLAIVGYYDTPWATAFDPPLTSVDVCASELARQAAGVVSAFLETPDLPPARVLVPPRLVVRASSTAAARLGPSCSD